MPHCCREMAPKVEHAHHQSPPQSGAHGRVTFEAPASNQAQGNQHRAGNHGTTHYIGKNADGTRGVFLGHKGQAPNQSGGNEKKTSP